MCFPGRWQERIQRGLAPNSRTDLYSLRGARVWSKIVLVTGAHISLKIPLEVGVNIKKGTYTAGLMRGYADDGAMI